jgi:drug/metabolite transporter (DMT)-like permease
VTTAGTRAARSRAGGAGLSLAVLSAATFGTSGTFAASLIGAGWSPAAAVTARICASAVMLTIPALLQLRGRWPSLRRAAGRVAAYGLVAVAGCQLFYFNAIQRMPVGVALLLEYLGAVLVVGWLWLRHGQRPRRLTVAGAVTAIAGLALVLGLGGSVRLDPVGVMWGLLAAAGLAIYFLLSAAGDEEPLPPVVMAWAGMCVGAAALGAAGWAGLVPIAATASPVHFLGYSVSWLVPVLGLSLVAAVIAYVAGIGAARRLGARLASFVGMTEVMFAVAFAWLLLGQLPSAEQFLGGVFILAGVALVRLDELRAPAPAGRPRSPAGEPPGRAGPSRESPGRAGPGRRISAGRGRHRLLTRDQETAGRAPEGSGPPSCRPGPAPAVRDEGKAPGPVPQWRGRASMPSLLPLPST